MESNPNGANQTTSDPREQKMWDFYIEGMAKGIVNAYESSIKAGYSEDHSRNITMQGWFKERLSELERKEMLSLAEKVLMKTLKYKTEKISENGVEEVRTDLLRIQTDVSKHVTSTIGKNKGYSTRTEQTGAEGKDLYGSLSKEDLELAKIINEQRRNTRTNIKSEGSDAEPMGGEVSDKE